jgi:hypothetical protein
MNAPDAVEPERRAFIARQMDLFAVRCSEMVERIAAREVRFIDGVDILYDAAIWSGLADSAGDDAVQRVLAAAFISAPRRPCHRVRDHQASRRRS